MFRRTGRYKKKFSKRRPRRIKKSFAKRVKKIINNNTETKDYLTTYGTITAPQAFTANFGAIVNLQIPQGTTTFSRIGNSVDLIRIQMMIHISTISVGNLALQLMRVFVVRLHKNTIFAVADFPEPNIIWNTENRNKYFLMMDKTVLIGPTPIVTAAIVQNYPVGFTRVNKTFRLKKKIMYPPTAGGATPTNWDLYYCIKTQFNAGDYVHYSQFKHFYKD